MKKINAFFILFLLCFLNANAQQVGSWRLHFKYSLSKDIAYSNNKIISATEEALLLAEINGGTIEIRELDKSNALSDIGISKIAYCEALETFVVAYNSSNIDLISNNLDITNIPDIKNKLSAGSKKINNIFVLDTKAYLSTDLGVIVLDIENQEIEDTYIIGDNGSNVVVKDLAIVNDTIYALTSNEGLKSTPLNGVNLLDFSNWQANTGIPSGNAQFIEAFQGSLFAVVNDYKLYQKSNSQWNLIFEDSTTLFNSLVASEKLVAVYKKDSMGTALKERFLSLDKNLVQDTLINANALNPYIGIYNKQNEFYIADLSWGLIDYNKNQRISPSGKPANSNVFALSSRKSRVFAAGGGITNNLDANGSGAGFYYFENDEWTNINRFTKDGLNGIQDFIDVKENPINNTIYAGTSTGLVVYDYNSVVVYDTSNSIIKVQNAGGGRRFISGVDFDSQGNVWMVNSRTNLPLLVLDRNGDWFQYPLSFGGNLKYKSIFVDNSNQKWITLRGKGISVFPSLDDLNTTASSISLTTSSADLPHSNINTIAQDKNGSIWVGTDEGIGVFDCPENIFDPSSNCTVSRRIKSTLDLYTEYLFDTDIVYAIVVDGANRKWVGTSSGAWLISESGDSIIHSFNTENSPLPSNEVFSIAINEETGEVFFGTSFGIASYVSDATEPADDISGIKAFPNPVGPNYNGTISVTGLVENTYIKITDINGTLIHDGYALGGKFIWNGKSYNGNRAKSGVYLVFSSDSQSKNKAITKIVFIN